MRRISMGNKFWMVYVDGTQGTSKMHVKKDLAIKEAERLFAKFNRQRAVYVLELIKTLK